MTRTTRATESTTPTPGPSGAHHSWQIENLRRSVVMLSPGQPALKREEALEVLEELQITQRRLESLRSGLAALVAEPSTG